MHVCNALAVASKNMPQGGPRIGRTEVEVLDRELWMMSVGRVIDSKGDEAPLGSTGAELSGASTQLHEQGALGGQVEGMVRQQLFFLGAQVNLRELRAGRGWRLI